MCTITVLLCDGGAHTVSEGSVHQANHGHIDSMMMSAGCTWHRIVRTAEMRRRAFAWLGAAKSLICCSSLQRISSAFFLVTATGNFQNPSCLAGTACYELRQQNKEEI
jgi:hypothetical protein